MAKNFAKRHLQSLRIKKLGESISEGMDIFLDQTQQWAKWSKTQITKDIYDHLWEDLPFSQTEKGKIESLPEMGSRLLLPDALQRETLDMWMMNSVLTQYTTHEVKSELRKLELEPKIAQVMENAYDRIIH